MPFINYTTSQSCQSDGGFIALQTATHALPSDPDTWEFLIVGFDDGIDYGFPFDPLDLPMGSGALPDQNYRTQVRCYRGGARYDADNTYLTVSCGTVSDLELTLSEVNAPTSFGTATGTFTVQATSSAGGVLLALNPPSGPSGLVPDGSGKYTFTGMLAGVYTVRATDASGTTADLLVTVPEAEVGGCTDTTADNYDPTATFDNGSCTYTPPAQTPFFAVPLLNGLRFVVPEIPDNCGTFETTDNTLFCAQTRPGMQRRPLFYQRVAKCDPLPVQVLTNYEQVQAVVHRVSDGVAVLIQPMEKVLALTGWSFAMDVELSSSADGFTLLQPAGMGFPADLLAAKRVVVHGLPGGDQTYRVLRSGRASLVSSDDYVVLNRRWETGPDVVSIEWPVSLANFNVWEVAANTASLPEGLYEMRLHASQPSNPAWGTVTAISEPWRLAYEHPTTVLVEYKNSDNCYGTVFSTGFTPRLRVPGVFFRQKNGGQLSVHRNSDYTPVLLTSTAARLLALETQGLPPYLHEKLYLACRLDWLRVNGRMYRAGENVYEASEQRAYPLSNGRIDLEQVPFLGTGNGDDQLQADQQDSLLTLRLGGFLRLRG